MDMMTDIPSPLPTLARYAIMVDVGYIYAAAGELLFSSSSRREYRVDTDKLIQALTRHADSQVRGELLRVYWYDAARDRVPTIDQRVIAQMAWVKLRLGNLNARGQQKGVDAQIRADMEALARHRAITDAVLVAGDEDMVPAVEAAQAYGVRACVLSADPTYSGLARLLEMNVIEVAGLAEQVTALKQHWGQHDLFILHYRDADQAGAAGNFDAKAKAIERLDGEIPQQLSLNPDVLAVAGGHSTPYRCARSHGAARHRRHPR